MPAEFESGAFYREAAWHRDGTVVDKTMTAREAMKLGGLTWQVVLADVMYAGQVIDGYSATLRTDTNSILGIVGPRYHPIQNADMFTFFDNVVDPDEGAFYHTVGSLRGGRVVWALAKVPGDFYAVKDDRVENYLLLASSHDGSMGLVAKHTCVRVVCMNTLRAALGSSSPVTVKIRHTQGAQALIRQAYSLLGFASKRSTSMKEFADFLVGKQVGGKFVGKFLEKLFPVKSKEDKVSPQLARKREAVELLFADAATNNIPGMEGTAWGLYNAAIEYIDHDLPSHKGTDTLYRTWFGSGEQLKVKAANLLLKQLEGEIDN